MENMKEVKALIGTLEAQIEMLESINKNIRTDCDKIGMILYSNEAVMKSSIIGDTISKSYHNLMCAVIDGGDDYKKRLQCAAEAFSLLQYRNYLETK